jgi:hypothetical protein
MVDMKAAGANGVYLLFMFFCWVATLDAFGGILATVTDTGVEVDFYQDRYEVVKPDISSPTLKYSAKACSSDTCDKCQSGGGGLVAMMFFAFFLTLGSLFLGIVRAFGLETKIPKLNLDAEKCMKFEFFFVIAETVLFFFGIIAFGVCFSQINDDLVGDQELSGTGFGFIIFCFLMQVLLLIGLTFYMRKHPELHRISGGTAPAKTNDNPANPPASSSGGQNMGAIDPTPNPNSQPPAQNYASQPAGASDMPR